MAYLKQQIVQKIKKARASYASVRAKKFAWIKHTAEERKKQIAVPKQVYNDIYIKKDNWIKNIFKK